MCACVFIFACVFLFLCVCVCACVRVSVPVPVSVCGHARAYIHMCKTVYMNSHRPCRKRDQCQSVSFQSMYMHAYVQIYTLTFAGALKQNNKMSIRVTPVHVHTCMHAYIQICSFAGTLKQNKKMSARVHTNMHAHIHTYTYIFRDSEAKQEDANPFHSVIRQKVSTYACMHVCKIYIHIYIQREGALFIACM
jgi:hypothetical protein